MRVNETNDDDYSTIKNEMINEIVENVLRTKENGERMNRILINKKINRTSLGHVASFRTDIFIDK